MYRYNVRRQTMNFQNIEFKRRFSTNFYKNKFIKLGEMSFDKDFVNDSRGDMYPIINKSADCRERIEDGKYRVLCGSVTRFMCQFFPYATYSLNAEINHGEVGFLFRLPNADALIAIANDSLTYTCGDTHIEMPIPTPFSLRVSCRPGKFDIFLDDGKCFTTISEPKFENSNSEEIFSNGFAALYASGDALTNHVSAYIDSGISIADMRPICCENGEIMQENGRVYITASLRMEEGAIQGVLSWIPSTAEFELCGALFYNSGDGKWCGDVAASILFHRAEGRWYLWVCSFSHGHVLGHAEFDGDPRFGVNVIDIELMEKADNGAVISEFAGFSGDEDPDFIYDSEKHRWLMAICRLDPVIHAYRYVFFESSSPFGGYHFIGKGLDGAETGGSFVRVDGELYFICGNSFDKTSDYRIYSKSTVIEPKFDYPDGGFRGWGTVMPIKQGSRTRYFWLTFDRHNASPYNWSYGNLYVFEAYTK